MKKAVRQMRGPGMNKGLKKPRRNKFPNTSDKPSKSSPAARSNDYKKAGQNSYISSELGHRLWGRD